MGDTEEFLVGVGAKWLKAAPTEEGIPCSAFLDAAEATYAIFDVITGMGVVKSDMAGNHKKIKENWQAGGASESLTLEKIMDAELAGKDAKKVVVDAKTSMCRLLWLKRALMFIERMLIALIEDAGRSMKEAVTISYEKTLVRHHNFIVKGTFKAAMIAAPSRENFIKKLGANPDKVMEDMKQLMPKFHAIVDQINKYLVGKGVEHADA